MIEIIMKFLARVDSEVVDVSFVRMGKEYRLMLVWGTLHGPPSILEMIVSEEHLRKEPEKALQALNDLYKKYKATVIDRLKGIKTVNISPKVGSC